MPPLIKQVPFGERVWRLQGGADDAYHANIEHVTYALTPLLAAARRRVAPDSTILDIGANLGLTSLALSDLVPDGLVLAFEPAPATLRHLEANLALNGVRNVTVVPTAIGSEAGAVHFAASQQHAAGAHVVQASHAGGPAATIEVPVVTVDQWLADHGVDRVDFVKLDVEGHEPWVLSGARRVIARERPAIYMEFNAWCLLAFGNVNPVRFAKGLWRSFRVSSVDPDGTERELDSPLGFAHDNLVKHGANEDVLLEPRDGVELAPLDELLGGGQ